MTKAETEGGGAAGVDWRQEGRMKNTRGEERRMKGGHRGGEVWKSPTRDTRREKQRASFISSKGDSGGGNEKGRASGTSGSYKHRHLLQGVKNLS